MDCRTIEINGIIIKGDRIIKSPAISDEALKGDMGRRPIGGGSISSFDGTFTDEKILVKTADFTNDEVLVQIGDISDAYEMLKQKLMSKELTFDTLFCTVFEVIDEYFGRFENVSERMTYYKSEDRVSDNDNYNKITNLKGKSSAMCVERAALAQNLLKVIGINSIFKSSTVVVNGKIDQHAYNLVEYNDKYYIFDSTIPTLRDEAISPIIAEIPKEAFDAISMPISIINGYSVETSHFNPLKNMDYCITYDTLGKRPRENLIISDDSKEKHI